MVVKTTAPLRNICPTVVTRDSWLKGESTTDVADEQISAEVADDIMDLFCNFIGNPNISQLRKCDACHTRTKCVAKHMCTFDLEWTPRRVISVEVS